MGISAGDLRQVARELFKLIKSHWTLEGALEFCQLMLPEKYLEAKAVSILILERFVKFLKKEHIFLIKKWINKNYCTNWANIDHICSDIVSPLIEAYLDLIDEIITWAGSSNRWLRQASAVSFIKLARQGHYLTSVYRIAKRLFSDQDDLVQKANGWLLREAGKADMKQLEKFLLIHGNKIPRTTLRYAIEKFPETKRKEILIKTKKK